MNRKPTHQTNGSSIHISRTPSPDVEPVAELPPQAPVQLVASPEQRVPTPFPPVQPPIDQPFADELLDQATGYQELVNQPTGYEQPIDQAAGYQQPVDQPSGVFVPSTSAPAECQLPPLPLAMPIPSRTLSPVRHQLLNAQLSASSSDGVPPSRTLSPVHHQLLNPQLSASSSDGVPPIPLTPTVHVITPYPFALSGSSSAASFEAISHLIRRLREDRRTNWESRSRSVASGLYEFANMLMPSLPEYEAPVYDDVAAQEEVERQRRREALRCFYWMCGAAGLIGSALVGQQIGNIIYKWQLR